MEASDRDPTAYRGLSIVVNPSGADSEAVTDAFMVLEASTNPMFTTTLYAHPRDQVKTYATETEARDAALRLAHEWIDAHAKKVAAPG